MSGKKMKSLIEVKYGDSEHGDRYEEGYRKFREEDRQQLRKERRQIPITVKGVKVVGGYTMAIALQRLVIEAHLQPKKSLSDADQAYPLRVK